MEWIVSALSPKFFPVKYSYMVNACLPDTVAVATDLMHSSIGDSPYFTYLPNWTLVFTYCVLRFGTMIISATYNPIYVATSVDRNLD